MRIGVIVMNKKKIVGVIFSTLLAMGLMAGCGSENQAAGEGSGTGKEFLNDA